MISRRFVLNIILLCLLLASGGLARAVERIEVSLGDLQGEGWQAQDIALSVQLHPDSEHAGELRIARLHLPEPLGRVETVRLLCERLQYDAVQTDCAGRVRIEHLLGEPVQGRMQLQHDAATGALHVRLSQLALAGGSWRVDARLNTAGWHVELQLQQVSGEALAALLARLDMPLEHQFKARLDGRIEARGAGETVTALTLAVNGQGVEFANPVGTQAGEKLTLNLNADLQQRAGIWSGHVAANFSAGALFIDPLYMEFDGGRALALSSQLRWDSTQQSLQLDNLKLAHSGVMQADADLSLALGSDSPLQQARVAIARAQLPAAFDTYMQPWLRGGFGDELATAGEFSGRYVTRVGGDTELHVQLRGVDIDDPRQRFGFRQLNGVLDWGTNDRARVSQLQWASGSLFKLALGATQLAVNSQGTRFELREPITVPLLDGSLLIDELALSDPGGEAMQWRFDAVLTPVSMEAVCEAFGWPAFGGQLSGMIPAVKYADNKLEVGGVLLVKAFDGALTVRNLRLETPFGRVPRLAADLAIDNLDLNALTSTFSFGKIEGRLDGQVNGLRMQSWQPVAFDARFATPENDKSRHRISQKAVDNLSSIGGGVGGALSRSFLGVFEEFPYDRLGLSCRLANGVCQMGGVAPAANGYYIVKGRFLPPRIDVVGYADRVDWHTLIDRLKAVTLEEGPTIQ